MKRSLAATLIAATLLLSGCDSTTDPTPASPVTLSAVTLPPSAVAAARPRPASVAAIDSIRLTRVRVLLRHVRFDRESDSLEYRTLPLILDLQVTTALQDVFVGSLPDGIYRRVRFRVHRIEEEDLRRMAPAERPAFDDFMAGDRYSVIAEGTIHENGSSAGIPFVHRSRVDDEQEHELRRSFTVVGGSAVTVTMVLDVGSWFAGGSGGLLDPRDGDNRNEIDDNIRASIDVFEDSDRDGRDD